MSTKDHWVYKNTTDIRTGFLYKTGKYTLFYNNIEAVICQKYEYAMNECNAKENFFF